MYSGQLETTKDLSVSDRSFAVLQTVGSCLRSGVPNAGSTAKLAMPASAPAEPRSTVRRLSPPATATPKMRENRVDIGIMAPPSTGDKDSVVSIRFHN